MAAGLMLESTQRQWGGTPTDSDSPHEMISYTSHQDVHAVAERRPPSPGVCPFRSVSSYGWMQNISQRNSQRDDADGLLLHRHLCVMLQSI